MTSEEIIKLWNVKRQGQQRLIEDYDQLLRITPYQDSEDKILNQNILTHFWMNVQVPNGCGEEDTPFDIWQTWHRAIDKNFDFVGTSGYVESTRQNGLQITLCQDSDVDEAIEELNQWLQYVKPSKDGIFIDIFEHTLSAGGIYYLVISNDIEHFTLTVCTYGTFSVLKEFDNLRDSLEYIKKHHYYE